MRNPMTPYPVAAFQIAPNPPRAVREAAQRFDKVADRWGELRGTIQDAEAEAKQAVAEANRAATDAAKTGKTGPDTAAVEREHDERLAALRAQEQAQARAMDELGNDLAAAIAEHRDAYLAAQVQAEGKAGDTLRALLVQLRQALADLGHARQGRLWVEAFDAGEARVGEAQQFWGGRLLADTSSLVREANADPLALVAIIEQALEPAAPRSHVVSR